MSDEEAEMRRVWGAFYGQVIGDALGVTCEFLNVEATTAEIAAVRKKAGRMSKDSILPMVGCERRGVKAGQFTDDTEMALSLARSLIAKKDFDKVDVACAYSFWLCATQPSDSGMTTQNALRSDIFYNPDTKITPHWRQELTEEQKHQIFETVQKNVQKFNTKSLSNGALMRISPLAIAFRKLSIPQLREIAKADTSLTHASPIVADAVATYCVALAALLKGKNNTEAFDEAFASAETPMVQEYLKDAKTHDIPIKLFQEDFSKPFTVINGDGQKQGYIGVAFQSAFYQLLHAKDFASGLENAIARGGDTDTNGCIVGALIGARFGVYEIPKEWIDTVKAAEPCRLCLDDSRKYMDLTFLSIEDVDSLVPKLADVFQAQ
uniref:ADP-ribosylhydrolase ARH3 n=1 Tax=Panagrolaimus superbus TaxID=310955 RepID=A0A914Y680_9BILA